MNTLQENEDNQNKNMLTRSLLIGPNNTNQSQKDTNPKNQEGSIKLEVLDKAIKFNHNTIDANKQYEYNITGVKTDLAFANIVKNDSFNLESSLYKDNNSKVKKNLNYSNYQNNNSSIKKSNNKDNKDNYYDGNTLSRENNKSMNLDYSKEAKLELFNESLIKQIEDFGYSRDYIITCLRNNENNYCTACYYLLMKQMS